MTYSLSLSFVKLFFREIYNILKESDKQIIEIWYKISEFDSLKRFDENQLNNFLLNFEFIKKERWRHISINKIKFIFECLKILDIDIHKLSEIVDYNGFEYLIQEILEKNGYKTTKNFRFSDKSNFKSKTSQKRYEIDVIGINRKFVLIIDAKQWKRRDSYGAINKAADLQYQRVIALKKNPEIFSNLIQAIQPKFNRKTDLPYILIPIMLTLEDNGSKFNDNQVPLVSIYNFNSFTQNMQKYLHYYKTIKIHKVSLQTKLR